MSVVKQKYTEQSNRHCGDCKHFGYLPGKLNGYSGAGYNKVNDLTSGCFECEGAGRGKFTVCLAAFDVCGNFKPR